MAEPQWGMCVSDTDVTFPISFGTACYVIVATSYDTDHNYEEAFNIVPPDTKSQFHIHNRYGGYTGRWIAIGK